LGGDVFSIADIAAYPWLGRYIKTLDINIERLPHVRDWIDRIEARPGWQRIDMQCRTLFKKGLSLQQQANQADLDAFFGRAVMPGP
jgi:GST-like protein